MPSTPTHLLRIESISSGYDDFIALNISFQSVEQRTIQVARGEGRQSILIKVDVLGCLVGRHFTLDKEGDPPSLLAQCLPPSYLVTLSDIRQDGEEQLSRQLNWLTGLQP